LPKKAGMKKVVEQPPSREDIRIVAILECLGFNIQLLSSTGYVSAKLQTLNQEDIAKIIDAFVNQSHTRFLKSFCYHLPFGTSAHKGSLIFS
jgi:hypothetical protein